MGPPRWLLSKTPLFDAVCGTAIGAPSLFVAGELFAHLHVGPHPATLVSAVAMATVGGVTLAVGGALWRDVWITHKAKRAVQAQIKRDLLAHPGSGGGAAPTK